MIKLLDIIEEIYLAVAHNILMNLYRDIHRNNI